jgi:RimJ/RimL family protein N-acetyltransferase
MSTCPISSDRAADAAALVRLVRSRPNDRIDPYPPSVESEVLADTGARENDETCRPRIAVASDELVGYGALNFSPLLKRALLVGPVIHPAHRRNGYGLQILTELLDQAAANQQRSVRAVVGEDNAAGQALLSHAGLKRKERHTCLRLTRPARFLEMKMGGISVRRAWADDSELIAELGRRLVARTERQTRSLLKTSTYAVVVAFKGLKPVGFAEVDMRHGDVATLEQVEGPPALIQKGLGNLLIAETIRIVFQDEQVEALELLMEGTHRARIDAYAGIGFEPREELVAYERKI